MGAGRAGKEPDYDASWITSLSPLTSGRSSARGSSTFPGVVGGESCTAENVCPSAPPVSGRERVTLPLASVESSGFQLPQNFARRCLGEPDDLPNLRKASLHQHVAEDRHVF